MQLCEAVSFFIRKNVNKEGVYGLGEVRAMELPFNLFLSLLISYNNATRLLYSHIQRLKHFPISYSHKSFTKKTLDLNLSIIEKNNNFFKYTVGLKFKFFLSFQCDEM